jgi:hypothetical protein
MIATHESVIFSRRPINDDIVSEASKFAKEITIQHCTAKYWNNIGVALA